MFDYVAMVVVYNRESIEWLCIVIDAFIVYQEYIDDVVTLKLTQVFITNFFIKRSSMFITLYYLEYTSLWVL